MDKSERDHNLRLAREHREAADRERQLADVARVANAPVQAQRHLLNAGLHDRRAAAYEVAAGQGGG